MIIKRTKLFSASKDKDNKEIAGQAIAGAGIGALAYGAGDFAARGKDIKDKAGREILSERYEKKASGLKSKAEKAEKEVTKAKESLGKVDPADKKAIKEAKKSVKSAEEKVKKIGDKQVGLKDRAKKIISGEKLTKAEENILGKTSKAKVVGKYIKNNKKALGGAAIAGAVLAGTHSAYMKNKDKEDYKKNVEAGIKRAEKQGRRER